jgi:hypothetical protein
VKISIESNLIHCKFCDAVTLNKSNQVKQNRLKPKFKNHLHSSAQIGIYGLGYIISTPNECLL